MGFSVPAAGHRWPEPYTPSGHGVCLAAIFQHSTFTCFMPLLPISLLWWSLIYFPASICPHPLSTAPLLRYESSR